jgi:catechol 2,3-dioxygenase-like lactoylglutathione lyase family enzyme
VKESIDFYSKILGLVLIERPPAFEFDGAWLFNYGVGVHLIQAKDEDSLPKTDRGLDPRDNHISFQVIDSILWLSDNHMYSFTHIFLCIQDFFYMYFCQF